LIQCEYGDVHFLHSPIKRCLKDAKFLVVFTHGHPVVVPFHDINVVCEEHLKQLRKRGTKMEFYEIISYNEKVEFT
jgi:hypothetical protein